MNREQRRALERGRRDKHTAAKAGRTIPVDGPGRLVRSGQNQAVTEWADMPAKVPGRHRWIATAVHILNDRQAEAGANPLRDTFLGADSLAYVGVGCVDCEEPWESARLHACPAGDQWRPPT